MVATWKAGAMMVSINPMYREREIQALLLDSGAKALVTLESLYGDVATNVVGQTALEVVITTSELDFLDAEPPALLEGATRRRDAGAHDLLELARAHDGERLEPVELSPSDVAVLIYTSGTTGPAKG